MREEDPKPPTKVVAGEPPDGTVHAVVDLPKMVVGESVCFLVNGIKVRITKLKEENERLQGVIETYRKYVRVVCTNTLPDDALLTTTIRAEYPGLPSKEFSHVDGYFCINCAKLAFKAWTREVAIVDTPHRLRPS